MNILVISNFYPPHTIGGYELGCRDLVEVLRARGHYVQVLTSSYGLPAPQSEAGIVRWLDVDLGWDFGAWETGLRLFQKELRNRQALQRALQTFRPDLVYIWGLRYSSISLVMLAQQSGLPVCFYVSDEWLAHWNEQDRWFQTPHNPVRRVLKRTLDAVVGVFGGRVQASAFAVGNAECTSAYIADGLRVSGMLRDEARVIRWGIDPARIVQRVANGQFPTRLLYVGQMVAHKGVHTAIEAFMQLVQTRPNDDLRLTIVGAAIDTAYVARLQALATPLGEQVQFVGGLPREQVARVYAEHDLLLFPSIWPEPFSITLLESLAAGLAVVATPTGGTPEVLIDNGNALLFPAGDAAACAAQIARLLDDPALFQRLCKHGTETIHGSFRLEQMVDAIELHLQQVAYG